jgi:zinc protease
VHFPEHVTTPVVLHHHGQDDQAAAVIAWPTGGGSADIREMRKLDVLAAVFRDRIIERLRSQAGVSYSPSVDSDWPLGLGAGGRIAAMGLVPPDKTDFFFSLSREIAADLVAHPIDADELRRTIAPMTQQLVRRSTGNMFWMQLAAGGTRDPVRLAAINTVVSDVATTTPAEVQALAAKYLRADKDWTVVVLPTPKPAPARPAAAKPVAVRVAAKARARSL